MTAAHKPVPATFDAAERWTTGRGDGSGLYLAGDPKRRVQVADFGLGGRAPGGSAVAADRALVAAQAPAMYLVLLDLISNARDVGSLIEKSGRPHEGHGPPCDCALCAGVVALALAEGGGRCIVCGCVDDDGCEEGCSWADADRLRCTAHPEDVQAKARRVLAKLTHR
jgi:hypothetical protein